MLAEIDQEGWIENGKICKLFKRILVHFVFASRLPFRKVGSNPEDLAFALFLFLFLFLLFEPVWAHEEFCWPAACDESPTKSAIRGRIYSLWIYVYKSSTLSGSDGNFCSVCYKHVNPSGSFLIVKPSIGWRFVGEVCFLSIAC
jgi:hypothetical protein